MRAAKGETDIMIGARSALFTPFPNLGLIIIDEEHEGAYKSETTPRYHAREVAEKLAQLSGAALVLGSATPSVEAYFKTEDKTYRLFTLAKRAKTGSEMAAVEVVDLRKEMENGNKSIFSERLQELIRDRLEKKEQVMLFINRRGYSSFVSCRSCGEAVKCPHCDVSLTLHNRQRLCAITAATRSPCQSCVRIADLRILRVLVLVRRKSRRWRHRCFRRQGFYGWTWTPPRKKAVMRKSYLLSQRAGQTFSSAPR